MFTDAAAATRERFGSLVRACRLDNEMTQEDLADAVGVHQPSVSAWELGRTLPAPGTMLDLARLFNLDLAILTDPPAEPPVLLETAAE